MTNSTTETGPRWAIAVLNSQQHLQLHPGSECLRVGSKNIDSEDADTDIRNSCQWVTLRDACVAGHHCTLELNEDPNGQPTVTVENQDRSIVLSHGPRLHRGQSTELRLPFMFCVGDTHVQVFALPSLPSRASVKPGSGNQSDQLVPAATDGEDRIPNSSGESQSPAAATLASWLDALGDLHRSVAGSHEFFVQAARAVFNPGGLDGGIILLPGTTAGEQSNWNIAASHMPYAGYGIGFRPEVVRRATESRSTVVDNLNPRDTEATENTLHNAVASPVLDAAGNVVAMVYGFRSRHRTNNRHAIRSLEANFVKVVADSIAAGMIRMDAEAAAAQSRALLDQAFSPKVARQLENDPTVLSGQTREVTVLFTDLRGFSTISEQIGSEQTYELLTDVMDCFSQLVAEHDGVVIDFFGDGLAAFWNAPLDQPDHALLACRCGFEMLASLPSLNEKWEQRLPQRIDIGVGINTGMAQVGNAGSRSRLKYGPQGNTVNLASRIEGLTRHVGASMIVSRSTAERVADEFDSRRICRTQLAGMKRTADVFELLRSSSGRDAKYLRLYDSALESLESAKYSRALAILADLQIQDENDGVVRFLLSQVIARQEGVASAFGGEKLVSEDCRPIALVHSVSQE